MNLNLHQTMVLLLVSRRLHKKILPHCLPAKYTQLRLKHDLNTDFQFETNNYFTHYKYSAVIRINM